MNKYSTQKGNLSFMGMCLLIILFYLLICYVFRKYLSTIIIMTLIIGAFDYFLVVGANMNK